jgi:aspartyl-tRNA(Asn)/glutamyl-tRNA(Gln) amidotransferase subunit A
MRTGRGADRRHRPRMNLWELTAAELAAGYAAKTFSPRDALASVLSRMEAVNPQINAVVTLDIAGAQAAADASSTRWRDGVALGAFDGVPLTVKDNIPVRGMRATWGSRIYQNWIPEKDELPIALLREGGAVIFGKTNCPEFTLQGYTDNLLFGVTRNPWNLELTPGGSSGGAVAAVVAGIGPVAVGTDGGGSIRRPAAHTGLVGLKPSRDVVARRDGFPVILLDCEVIGPIARTVDDTRALFQALGGRIALQMTAEPEARQRRILYVRQFGGSPVDGEIARSVADAANNLAALGHAVEEGEAPFDIDALNNAWPVISQVGLAWLLKDYAERLDEISPPMQAMARSGVVLSATAYYDAIDVVTRLRQTLHAFFARYDLILTPATAALPWPATEPFPPEINGEPVGPRGHAIFTAFANMAGCPAISIPCRPSKSGLPIGFQLVGDVGRDELLFTLAARYEAAHPGVGRCLSVSVDVAPRLERS